MDKRRGVVAAGSVWESRMKSDQVKGGIKVFKAEKEQEEEQEGGNVGGSRLRRTSIGSSKRKTCSPIQISKGKTEEPCISDGIKKSLPFHTRSPIQSRKIRSDMQKGGGEAAGKLRKIKSDPIKKNAIHSIELRKTKSELDRVQENEPNDELDDGFEKIEAEKDENVEDFDVCQEKEISSNVGVVQNSPESVVHVGGDSESDGDVVDDEEIEIEMENESFDVKEISIPESKVTVKQQENDMVDVNEPEKKIVLNESEKKVVTNEAEQKKVVNANMRFHHKNERRPVSVPLVVKQSPTIRRNSKIYQNFSKPTSSKKFSVSYSVNFVYFWV